MRYKKRNYVIVLVVVGITGLAALTACDLQPQNLPIGINLEATLAVHNARASEIDLSIQQTKSAEAYATQQANNARIEGTRQASDRATATASHIQGTRTAQENTVSETRVHQELRSSSLSIQQEEHEFYLQATKDIAAHNAALARAGVEITREHNEYLRQVSQEDELAGIKNKALNISIIIGSIVVIVLLCLLVLVIGVWAYRRVQESKPYTIISREDGRKTYLLGDGVEAYDEFNGYEGVYEEYQPSVALLPPTTEPVREGVTPVTQEKTTADWDVVYNRRDILLGEAVHSGKLLPWDTAIAPSITVGGRSRVGKNKSAVRPLVAQLLGNGYYVFSLRGMADDYKAFNTHPNFIDLTRGHLGDKSIIWFFKILTLVSKEVEERNQVLYRSGKSTWDDLTNEEIRKYGPKMVFVFDEYLNLMTKIQSQRNVVNLAQTVGWKVSKPSNVFDEADSLINSLVNESGKLGISAMFVLQMTNNATTPKVGAVGFKSTNKVAFDMGSAANSMSIMGTQDAYKLPRGRFLWVDPDEFETVQVQGFHLANDEPIHDYLRTRRRPLTLTPDWAKVVKDVILLDSRQERLRRLETPPAPVVNMQQKELYSQEEEVLEGVWESSGARQDFIMGPDLDLSDTAQSIKYNQILNFIVSGDVPEGKSINRLIEHFKNKKGLAISPNGNGYALLKLALLDSGTDYAKSINGYPWDLF